MDSREQLKAGIRHKRARVDMNANDSHENKQKQEMRMCKWMRNEATNEQRKNAGAAQHRRRDRAMTREIDEVQMEQQTEKQAQTRWKDQRACKSSTQAQRNPWRRNTKAAPAQQWQQSTLRIGTRAATVEDSATASEVR